MRPSGVSMTMARASGTLWLMAQKRTVNGREIEHRVFGDLVQLDHLEQAVLVELRLGEGQREAAAVDRHVDVAQHVGERAEMVFVAVGDEEGEHVVAALAQEGDVGQDEVDAQHLVAREGQPAVDHDDLAAVLDGRHVLADLAHPAERDDLQGVLIHSLQLVLVLSNEAARAGSAWGAGRPRPSNPWVRYSRPSLSSSTSTARRSSSEASTSGRRRPPTS